MTVKRQAERVEQAPRERILAAAFAAFMQHGYAGASTQEIARGARVSKRDLYAQFGSKQAMLAACIESRAERMQAPLPLPPPHDRAALAATLAAFGERLLLEATRAEVLAVWRLAITEADRAPEVGRTLDELGRHGTQRMLSTLLADAQAAGLLLPGDAGAMAEQFIAALWAGGLLARLLLRVAKPPDALEAATRAKTATEICLRLYAPAQDAQTALRITQPNQTHA